MKKKTLRRAIQASQAISQRLATLSDGELLQLAAEKKNTLLHTKARALVSKRGLRVGPPAGNTPPCGSEPREEMWRIHGE